MKTWTNDELNKAEKTDEMELASMRKDGTLRSPVTIWVVRLGNELFSRSVNGRDGAWFLGTQTRHEGHIRIGGVEKDVTFEDADPSLYDQLDAAYRAKYKRYAANVVNSVLTPHSRESTIKLVPK